MTKPIKQYQQELEEEIKSLRFADGKKKLPQVEPEEVIKKESTTDSECGLFVKGEHERCFAYSAQTACDKHGFVLDFEVGAGNLHDGQIRAVQENGLEPDTDSGTRCRLQDTEKAVSGVFV